MSKLNPKQREAVHYVDGPLLVLAGAGSGKTSVITRKIAYLIEQVGIPARNICATTFTNKAAREMRERVQQLVPKESSRGLMISTFHTLGLNILRRDHRILGYKSGFSIFDSQDAQTLVKELLIAQHGSEGDQVDVIVRRISDWKNDNILPAQAIAEAEGPADILCSQAYLRYQEALKAYNAMDFDDLIGLPVALFKAHPEVLDRWRRKIRYLLVDEYQDTNSAQYELVKLLVGGRSGLTVVGDDDQSIYAWRGAKPENLALLSTDHPELHVVKLEQNYRSSRRILKAANSVIDNNPHVFDKKLWSELGIGDAIRIIKNNSEDAECERIATEILDLKMRKGLRFGDFAVLYRSNHMSRLLELKLQQHQIPYLMSGGQSFFGRTEIKDIMAYLRLLINPDDDNAFLRIINLPRRKIGPSTLRGLGEYATQRDVSLYTAATELGLSQVLSENAIARLSEFISWMEATRQRCYEGDPVKGIRQLISDIDYKDWLDQNCSTPAMADRSMANVEFLLGGLEKTVADSESDDPLEEAISKLVLRDLLEKQAEEEQADDAVQLLTLHAAKGLEYPHVYMMGMEEGLLPHRNSIDTGTVEEERRLCYVGITRAQRNLTLSYCIKRKGYGGTIECTPSRFLDELPLDDISWEGREGGVPQESNAGETLAGLRNLFD